MKTEQRNMLKRFFLVMLMAVCFGSAFGQDLVRVTRYNLRGKTAAGTTPRNGIVAISRDLLKKYPLHSTIRLEGYGTFVVEDVMGARARRSVDIWSSKKIPNKNNVRLTLVRKPK